MEQVFLDKMIKGAENLGISFSKEQIDKFYYYYEILNEWNKVMNLTAITELEDVIYKHFIDSLSLVMAVKEIGERESNLIDVGTGAGFPGIPLKIIFPKISVVLLDSLNKRVRFLHEVIEKLNLTEIEAVHGRAEDFGQDRIYREKFDYCVSRAVANMATLAEYCIPFVKTGGVFVAYKSGKIQEEMERGKKAVEIFGGEVVNIEKFVLAETDAERELVVVKKVRKTDKRYPRKAGVPGKEPI